MESDYRKSVLSNGIRVISLPLRDRKGVAVGVWIASGSRDDTKGNEGIAHFTEHLLFKGTKRRSAKDIAQALERIGGSFDAYTSREETCYYAYLPARNLEVAIDIMGDILANSKIDSQDFEKERKVILEEMSENKDSLFDSAISSFYNVFFKNPELGHPILGKEDSVIRMMPRDVRDFIRQNYVGENSIIVAVGNVNHRELTELVEKYIDLPKSTKIVNRNPASENDAKGFFLVPRDSSQLNLVFGGKTFPFKDERRYPLGILDVLLGKGASSYLFQKVREEAGYAYNVYSSQEYFQDIGLWRIFAGIESSRAPEFLDLISSIFDEIKDDLITKEDMERVIGSITGRLLLESDSLSALMTRIAETEIFLGEFIKTEQSLHKFKKVKIEDVRELASELFIPERIIGVVLGNSDISKFPDWAQPSKD